MAAALERLAPGCQITIADKDPMISVPKYNAQLGKDWKANLDRFDTVIKSPGISPQELASVSIQTLSTSTQIFFDSIVGSGATIIGVTGSKGKSTVASLTAAILKAAKFDVDLIGNIGEPAVAHIETARKNKFFVQEISSYQLADLPVSPPIAVVTSFFPEHLDYHGSLEAYLEAKKHICRFQGKNDMVIFNASSPGAAAIAAESESRKLPYDASDAPVALGETHLIGIHNLFNIAAAWRVAEALGVHKRIAVQAITEFQGLPHRLQSLGITSGAEWVDDAISTTPESTIAALDALSERVTCLLLGGQDRGLDFTSLGRRIAQSNIALVLLFPGSGPRIRSAIEATKANVECIDVDSMESAVSIARKKLQAKKTSEGAGLVGPAPAGLNIVLLSPASPSYGMYKNFEEKGDDFRRKAGIGTRN